MHLIGNINLGLWTPPWQLDSEKFFISTFTLHWLSTLWDPAVGLIVHIQNCKEAGRIMTVEDDEMKFIAFWIAVDQQYAYGSLIELWWCKVTCYDDLYPTAKP